MARGRLAPHAAVDFSNPLGHTIPCSPSPRRRSSWLKPSRLFSDDELHEVIDALAANPEAGDVIPGTGGLRKVRVALSGRGKRGGARVIYYYHGATIPLYALAVYAKNEKSDLTPDEKKALTALLGIIKP